MQLFLDSIDIEEIKNYSSYGIIDGITTNPSLMAKADKNFSETARELCACIEGDVSIEVAAEDYETMIIEGNKISAIAPNAVVKLPITLPGLKACKYFSSKGIKVNMTLCFSAVQALLAAKAGATYVSPFIGRLDDNGQDGALLIADIRTIYDNYGFNTKILAASIRSVEHITEAAIYGADAATVPSKIMAVLIDHKLTVQGLEKFKQDWAKSGLKI